MTIKNSQLVLLVAIIVSYSCLSAIARAEETAPDSTMKLEGGEEVTLFKSLRVEGEDRIRIEFDRPTLHVDLNPKDAPGLEWESFHSVLDRHGLDLISPFVARSASDRSVYLARPWLDDFSSDGVARFRPALEGVDRWRLIVADSRGETVMQFDGKGKPPKEIVWDGLSLQGTPVQPGLTYSYVLEAFDKAGNKRNFVGDGFELPSYRIEDADGITMLFAGGKLRERSASTTVTGATPVVLLEVASWINQSTRSEEPIRVEVIAQSFQDAKRLAEEITTALKPLILGDPLRVQPFTTVQSDAPDQGSVAISVRY